MALRSSSDRRHAPFVGTPSHEPACPQAPTRATLASGTPPWGNTPFPHDRHGERGVFPMGGKRRGEIGWFRLIGESTFPHDR